MTAGTLAWKQPFVQGVRNSSPVERPGVDDERALSGPPKPRGARKPRAPVGEHSAGLEGVPGGALERAERQM